MPVSSVSALVPSHTKGSVTAALTALVPGAWGQVGEGPEAAPGLGRRDRLLQEK